MSRRYTLISVIKTDISLNAVFVYYFTVNIIIIGDRTIFTHIQQGVYFISNKLSGECVLFLFNFNFISIVHGYLQ